MNLLRSAMMRMLARIGLSIVMALVTASPSLGAVASSATAAVPPWTPDPQAVGDDDPAFIRIDAIGNAPDPRNSAEVPGIGAVPYSYRIAKYEVTNREYVALLNAVAVTADSSRLYDEQMTVDRLGGIERSGDAGAYRYAIKEGMAEMPVNFVCFDNAVRFCNWQHHGRPTGAPGASTTEDGAYAITNGTMVGPRKPGARCFLPSENEWYKAAYFDPAKDGPGKAGYWQYPTRSDTPPKGSKPDPTGVNVANLNGAAGGLTDVGAYPLAKSAYGVFDLVGNVTEWNETLVGRARGERGGGYKHAVDHALASFRTRRGGPFNRKGVIGFRIAKP